MIRIRKTAEMAPMTFVLCIAVLDSWSSSMQSCDCCDCSLFVVVLRCADVKK